MRPQELRAEGRQLDIFVTDLVPKSHDELQAVLQPLLRNGWLRPGGLVVVTFKFGQGYTEATWDKLARDQARQLEGLLEADTWTVPPSTVSPSLPLSLSLADFFLVSPFLEVVKEAAHAVEV